MSHRAAFRTLPHGELEYIRTKPYKPATPNHLHYTFLYAGNAEVNREMIRTARRRTKRHASDRESKRRSTRSVQANRIKSQVKSISLRQHRKTTIVWFMTRDR